MHHALCPQCNCYKSLTKKEFILIVSILKTCLCKAWGKEEITTAIRKQLKLNDGKNVTD